MEKPIIEVRGVGKKYDITHMRGGYVALRDVIASVARRPFSFLVHKTKQAVGLEKKEAFWALKDINFNVEKGEVIGVIGKNGAGKSTLLKILSQITPPTEGEIILRGRVGSLLEVGTGFHPELTGRENIFLNGAILGMKKKEIIKKFDEIVSFAGVDNFLDTPVKHYSSGMYVRLAFSVAAHMEPDILIIDEVLAVGDSEFQKKCLGKMDEITKKEGRTIFFVSHNLNAIQQLCGKTILLEKGHITKIGNTKDVINYYQNSNVVMNSMNEYKPMPGKDAQITKISIINSAGKPSARIDMNEPFFVDTEYEIYSKMTDAMVSFRFFSEGDLLLSTSDSDSSGKLSSYEQGKYKTRINIPTSLFNAGHYYLEVSINRPGIEFIDRKINIPFEILAGKDSRLSLYQNQIPGKIVIPIDHKTESIS